MFPPGSVGLDASEENVGVTEGKGLNVLRADINKGLPFEAMTFDTVFCSHVIEHVDSPLELLRESRRVLRRGGRIILGVPIEKTLVRLVREDYFGGHEGHLYGLSAECAGRLLRHAGFRGMGRFFNFPLVNRLPLVDRAFQAVSGGYCQYFCTMYWIVAETI
jgi:SAM-dependent methyltransferase